MLDKLPPEILGRVLEIATEAWGVGFLPTVCLVSSTCNDVVVSTPSLWGIIVVARNSSPPLLVQQLAKAKAADLNITFSGKGLNRPRTWKFAAALVSIAQNWVRVDMPTNLISLARWVDLTRVEVLNLRFDGGNGCDVDAFFDSPEGAIYTPPILHSFTASGLPEAWTTGFLGPRITYLDLGRLSTWKGTPTSLIQQYLSLVPNVHTLILSSISLLPLSASDALVHLPNLHNFEFSDIRVGAQLLLMIRAPALRTLIIRNATGTMSSVFSQWSQPGFLPANLQSLELSNCLCPQDIPFFIGWLARLPALLRLTIDSGEEDLCGDPSISSEATNLFPALASPNGAGPIVGGWLCPSLILLCLETPLRVSDILPIARARGGATPRAPGAPAKLRSMQGTLCSNGSADDVAELRSLFADPSDVRCLCLSCTFDTSVTL
ncbi:hypothetical protein DFH06DRAFT_1225605 [Mycena polygramma]|nr:hypothetical protein DFH06DRAFT_1225605 [Mycena polygramma]